MRASFEPFKNKSKEENEEARTLLAKQFIMGHSHTLTQVENQTIIEAISSPTFIESSFMFYKAYWGDGINETTWQEFWDQNSMDILEGDSVSWVAVQEPTNTMILMVIKRSNL